MNKFICISEEHPQKNHLGEDAGITQKRALFYLPSIGRHRIYRDDFKSPAKRLKLLEFKDKAKAEILCDEINETYGDDFKIEIT